MHLSMSCITYPIRAVGMLEPIPVDLGQGAQYTGVRSPVYLRASTETNTNTLTHERFRVADWCTLSLGCGRKPEKPQETQTLHAKPLLASRPKPRSFLLWHHSTDCDVDQSESYYVFVIVFATQCMCSQWYLDFPLGCLISWQLNRFITFPQHVELAFAYVANNYCLFCVHCVKSHQLYVADTECFKAPTPSKDDAV